MGDYPLHAANRGNVVASVSLIGTGAAAPTVDAGPMSNVFATPAVTRSGAGRYVLNLKDRWTSARITGATYRKSDYDTTPLHRRLVTRAVDAKGAGTIAVGVNDDDSAGTNAAVDLGATEAIDFELILCRAAP